MYNKLIQAILHSLGSFALSPQLQYMLLLGEGDTLMTKVYMGSLDHTINDPPWKKNTIPVSMPRHEGMKLTGSQLPK